VIEESQGKAEWRSAIAREHKYILLVPVIPTSPGYTLYPAAFDVNSFLDSTETFYQRADIKINLMIDQLIKDLQTDGYNVQKKVFVEGFSTGGMFAQRYALLHPERVQAVAAGHCGGFLTLPEVEHEDIELNWPAGINGFLSLVGSEFNRDAYMQAPQIIYIGEDDTEKSLLRHPEMLGGTQSQVTFLKSAFGNTDPGRLASQVDYLNDLGYDKITFKMYAGVGHQYTPDMRDDFLSFFELHK